MTVARRSVEWPIEQMMAMYDSGMTVAEISAALSAGEWEQYWCDSGNPGYQPSSKTVNKVLKRSGQKMRGRGAPLHRNVFWNGGRVVDKNGYVLVKANDHPHSTKSGYVREHRLAMEKSIGRYLTRTEVVHHKNGDKQDNRIENLELCHSQSAHIAGQHRHGDASRVAAAHAARRKMRADIVSALSPVMKYLHIDERVSIDAIASHTGFDRTTLKKWVSRCGLQPHQGGSDAIEQRHLPAVRKVVATLTASRLGAPLLRRYGAQSSV